MKTIAPKILAAPNQDSLAIYLDGSQQTYFQLRAAFLSLAPSSAKGYYATGVIPPCVLEVQHALGLLECDCMDIGHCMFITRWYCVETAQPIV